MKIRITLYKMDSAEFAKTLRVQNTSTFEKVPRERISLFQIIVNKILFRKGEVKLWKCF